MKLAIKKKLSKKNICNLVITFRDKYGLKHVDAMAIARNEIGKGLLFSLLDTDSDNVLKFRIGETAYMIDEDGAYFEERITGMYEARKGVEYHSSGADFYDDDIGDWVFRTKEERDGRLVRAAD